MYDTVSDLIQVRIALEPYINEVSEQYRVDPRWIKAIITQESGWNMFAVRYEPDYKYLYKTSKFKSGLISLDTEIITQKISWGLGQIMGALAREQGHTGFLAELLSPEINLKHMAIRLAVLKQRKSDPDYIFAGYNGGFGAMRKQASGLFTNQKYVTSVQGHMSKLV